MSTFQDVAERLRKPVKGAAILHSRERRATRVANEQREMQAALRRDERKCRVPRCEFAGKKLPIDPAHVVQHRGSGGNPDGSRTTRQSIAALCRCHHGRLDAGLLEIEILTDQGTDGPLQFSAMNEETGRWEVFATDQKFGVSVERAIR